MTKNIEANLLNVFLQDYKVDASYVDNPNIELKKSECIINPMTIYGVMSIICVLIKP